MHALVIATALLCADSSDVAQALDADTVSIVGTITETDTSWWQASVPSMSCTPTSWHQLRVRAQARLWDSPVGALVHFDTSGAALTGLWAHRTLPWATVYAGDVVGSCGTGLLFGTSRGGMRSSRTIQPPATILPMLRPCRSTVRDPAIRGVGVTTTLDSMGSTFSVASGIALLDSSYTTVMMGSFVQRTRTIGAGIINNATRETFSSSVWLQEKSDRSMFLAELGFSASILPSLQCYYRHGSRSFSVAATAWRIEPESNLHHGALLLRSSADNSWGYACSAGQTVPRLVSWNVLFQSYGTLSRSYSLPFPARNYSLHAEVRQTITALLHATWRLQLARTDEGTTVDGVRGLAQQQTVGVQCTIERIVTPRIRWQARADTRWRWSPTSEYQSSAASLTVNWKPVTDGEMHIRALVYASPLYDLSTWVMEYASADLQRLLVCNGYGAQFHASGTASITSGIRISALGVLRFDAASASTTVSGYISAGFALTTP